MRQEAEAFINEVFDWLDEKQNKINFLIEKTQRYFGNQLETQKLIEKLENQSREIGKINQKIEIICLHGSMWGWH